jgi:hypothetical protein
MGFNRRKMEDQRREAAEKEAATRRATDPQVLEDAGRLIAAWNEHQAKRMPMLFLPTIDAAIMAVDLRTLARHPDGAVTSLSFRRCHADRAGQMRRSQNSCAYRGRASPDEMREEHRRRVLGE